MKFLLIALAIALLPDIYIWSQFVQGNNTWWSVLYWTPLALIIIALILGFIIGIAPMFFLNMFFFLVLTTAIPKVLFTVVSLTVRLLSFLLPEAAYLCHISGFAF